MKPVWIISIIFFFVLLSYNISSTFFPLYMQQNGLDKFEIGVAYSMLPLLLAAVGFFIGTLIDKFGTKKIISLGILGYAIFIILFSFSFSLLTFLLSFVVIGISAAMFWIGGRAYIFGFKEITKNYSYFSTIVLSQAMIGPYVGGKVIENFGYNKLFALSAVLLFVIFVFVAIFFKPRYVKKIHRKFKLKIDIEFLKKVALLIILSSAGLGLFFPVFLKIKSFTESDIGLIVSIAMLFSVAIQIPAGRIVNILKIKKSVIFGFTLAAFGFYLLIGANSAAEILFAMFVLSFFAMTGIAIFTAMSKISKEKGHVAGLWEALHNSGTFMGSLALGFIFQNFGYAIMFGFLIFLSLLGALLGFKIRNSK